jgi:hypothetical protein
VAADGLELYISSGLKRKLPDELHLQLRGFPFKRLAAYWNGSPWVL